MDQKQLWWGDQVHNFRLISVWYLLTYFIPLSVCASLYIACFLRPLVSTIYAGSVLVGLGLGTMWAVQGHFVAVNSASNTVERSVRSFSPNEMTWLMRFFQYNKIEMVGFASVVLGPQHTVLLEMVRSF